MLRHLRLPQRLALFTGLVAVLLVAAACAADKDKADDGDAQVDRGPKTTIVVPADKPLVIGMALPLTGPVQLSGKEDRDAALVAIERWKRANGNQIKGHDVEVRVEDDGCFEADIAVQAAERLLRQEGLVGVIGPSCSAGAAAALPVLASGGIVAISNGVTSNSATSDQPAGGFFFRTSYRNDLTGAFVGIFASGQLASQAAYLIDDGETYGQDLANAAQQAMEQNGVAVTRESILTGTVDFGELAAKITQDAPAFVGFAGFNPEAALLYRQLRDAGYQGLFGAGDAAASVVDFVDPVGSVAEGALFAGCPLALPADFLAAFEKLHGHAPQASSFAAQSADAVTVLLDAVAQVAEEQPDGSLSISPATLRDKVRATALDGLSGPIAFDAKGDRVPHPGDDLTQLLDTAVAAGDPSVFVDLGLVPCQVQDGKLVNLLGPDAGQLLLP